MTSRALLHRATGLTLTGLLIENDIMDGKGVWRDDEMPNLADLDEAIRLSRPKADRNSSVAASAALNCAQHLVERLYPQASALCDEVA